MPTWRGVEVRQFAQSRAEPETIYALGSGLFFRSDDRGRRWIPLRAPKSIEHADLHVDPENARHVLIVARAQSTSEKPSLHESFDRGLTWSQRAPIKFLNPDGSPGGSFSPTRLVVPTQQRPSDWLAYDGRRFRSPDGGQTWVLQQDGPLNVETSPNGLTSLAWMTTCSGDPRMQV
ncbi:MAG: hypothetical protein EON54_04050 [Alcaligenaceae bacterium]|nr:MAG: hypothetical protein EON54_04050 [Alcaligenaceae bacterium]